MTDQRYDIGTDGPPVGGIWAHGVCRGRVHAELAGKGALIAVNGKNQHVVQFDDRDSGYAFGWHAWDGRDFDVDHRSTDKPEFEVSQDGGPMHAHFLNTKPVADNY